MKHATPTAHTHIRREHVLYESGKMDAGNFYSSACPFPMPPQYCYPQTDHTSGGSTFRDGNINEGQLSNAAPNIGLSQKIDFLVTSFEQHKASVSQTVDDLKSQLVVMKSEIKDIKDGTQQLEKTAEKSAPKKRKRVPTDLSVINGVYSMFINNECCTLFPVLTL